MHLVLHLLEEAARSRRIAVVVDGRSVDVGELLIESALTQAYLADFCQQVLKVVLTDERAVLHALLVYHIATNSKLTQYRSGPLTELRGTDGVDTVANRDDGIEGVEQGLASNLPFALGLNYREILGSCVLLQLSTIIYVLQVQPDIVC